MHKLLTIAAALLLAACGGGSGSGGAGPVQALPPPPAQAAPPAVAVALVGDDIVARWPTAQLPAGGVVASSLGQAIGMRPAVMVLQGDQAEDMVGAAQSSGACVVLVSVLPSTSAADLKALDFARRQAAAAYGVAYADAYTSLVEPPVDVAARLLDPTLSPDSRALRAEMDAGDGVHLSAAGYTELGTAVSKAMHGCAL